MLMFEPVGPVYVPRSPHSLSARITNEAVRLGCARLFLESGVKNHHAHELFEHEGFATCSIVMMKPLPAYSFVNCLKAAWCPGAVYNRSGRAMA